RPFADMLRTTEYCDGVWIDSKPRWYQVSQWLKLRKRLYEASFSWIYDLQTSNRSSSYFHLFGPGKPPKWSGIAKGCSHPHKNPQRDFMHTIDRQAEQLHACSIMDIPLPDISWADSDTTRFPITEPFVLMVPGGAPHRPAKRWPIRNYATLAQILIENGFTPILLGTHSEGPMLDQIAATCPKAVNLCGLTSMLDLAALGRRAVVAIGNDTGPMHMIALSNCPSMVLFSHDSDPKLCAPRGPHVEILRCETLEDLPVQTVLDALIDLAPGLEQIKTDAIA
ncbi:MAG: glycosyltransferase family 9 protein, partial [Rhodospirillales bacterium]|nr:glycosyltransferase family 9 protein [Rhodospirillales bacterium]